MKKLKLLFCSSLLVLSCSFSYGQSWLWGEGGYASLKSNDYASPVATDKSGNAYITGQYETTIIFGNDTLTDAVDNAYLTKYNSSGYVIWVRQVIDTTSTSFGTSVATDKSGNIYITGIFAGNANAGTFSLTSGINAYNAFIVKYAPNGNVLWAKQSLTPSAYSFVYGYSIAVDKSNNVFVTGIFADTANFGSFILTSPSQSNRNTFLVKYDSNGNILWAKQSKTLSVSSEGSANSVITDNSGNAYITGYFYDSLSFGATLLFGLESEASSFLAKYSSSGNLLWAKQNGSGSVSLCEANSVITDIENNPYITGYFEDSIKFDSKTIYSPMQCAFLTKYDTNGHVIWTEQSSSYWSGTGLASDAFNHIYMTGLTIENPDSLTFGGYTLHTNHSASYASFLMKFDTTGKATCGSLLNNLGAQQSNGVASDSTGTYIYMASSFDSIVFCGPDTLLDRGGGINTFVGRWHPCNSDADVSNISSPNPGVLLFPNPNNGKFNIIVSGKEQGISEVEVYNMLGEKVLTETLRSAQGDNSIDLTSQPNGIYVYRVISETGSLIGDGKLIIQK